MLQAFLSAFLLIAACEFGDKTQLLAAALGMRSRRPWEVVAASAVAATLNHVLAAWLGYRIGELLNGRTLSLLLAGVFAVIALTIAFSKVRLTELPAADSFLGYSALFLLAEIGDKTQLATAALTARYGHPSAVVIGGTLGALLPDALAVYLGRRVGDWIRWRRLRWLSVGVFASFAVYLAIGSHR